jgi:hypothetical protein
MPGEERVFAIERDGADQVFDPVAVDLDGKRSLVPTFCLNV